MMNDNIKKIPAEKFTFAQKGKRLHDTQLETKPIGYFKDAWLRFRKNKSAVVAFALILFLLLFAIIVPFFSEYDVNFRDGYYKTVLPKSELFARIGIWDGCSNETKPQAGYDYLNSIGVETGREVVKDVKNVREDARGDLYYEMKVDSYAKVGFVFANLSEADYQALMDYQNKTGIQVMYPIQNTHDVDYVMGNGGANFWYTLADPSYTSDGRAAYD